MKIYKLQNLYKLDDHEIINMVLFHQKYRIFLCGGECTRQRTQKAAET